MANVTWTKVDINDRNWANSWAGVDFDDPFLTAYEAEVFVNGKKDLATFIMNPACRSSVYVASLSYGYEWHYVCQEGTEFADMLAQLSDSMTGEMLKHLGFIEF